MNGHIINFLNYLPLLKQLIIKELKLKYRRSILGYLWSLLNPLFTMLIISAVFYKIFRFDIPNFPLYLICGQVIFGFFSEATSTAMTSIVYGGELIKKVYVPKYIFVLAKVCFSLINLLFSLLAIILVMVITKSTFHYSIFLIVIPFIYMYFISLGIGLILASLTVYFRDLIWLYTIFLTALSYFTPIFYPVSILSDSVFKLMKYNPLFHLVYYVRELIIYGRMPNLWENLSCICFAVFFMALGLYVFQKCRRNFILYI